MNYRPPIWTVIKRGWRKRCPHCGQAPIFKRWVTAHERCGACGLRFHRDHGNTWFFWIITDRIPLFLGIVALYFGFRARGWLPGMVFLSAMVVPIVGTMPRRQGVAIALDYLSRVYWPEGDNDIPEPWPPLDPTSGGAPSGPSSADIGH